MHQPRPYGLHAIGLPLTERDEAFVASVAKRIANLKELSKVDSIKMVYDLPDGGYVIVQDMGGNFRVISHKPIHGKDPIFDGLETDYIPMLFSGIITNAVVFEYEPVSLKLTEQARFRLTNYRHTEVKPSKDLELHRFRIEYDDRFKEFKPEIESSILETQYKNLSPSWYSGAMSEVVQIVGGYGRQDFANLPDEKTNKFERAQILLPKEWRDRIDNELIGLRLPAYSGLPPIDGSFQFDYKFNNTNAVGFDDKNRPWLLRISPSGVYAMPFPIVPATRTNAFKEYMQEVGDNEILAILDRFGGMPSGESFPMGDGFEAWLRAGVIIKVCDTSDFYSHIGYSSACGWSLNAKGNEGYNTCYDYDDSNGLGYGLTYKLKLDLISSDQYFGAERVDIAEQGPISDKVGLYLQQLIPTIGNASSERRAILYKLRRAKLGDIYQRALGRDGSKDRDYWHNLEMPPIAKHTGNITEVYRGYLYHPSPRGLQPEIKFPEPLLKGCVSHVFLPQPKGMNRKSYPNSDTIMFTYYVGDSLKAIKYFVDWDSFKKTEQGNFENIMQVGQWWNEVSVGNSSAQGYFYSSDIDDREIVAPRSITTEVVGKDLGFDTAPFFAFDAFFGMQGRLWRNRYYQHDRVMITTEDKQVGLAVCIPYLCRNAAIHSKRIDIASETTTKSRQLYYEEDPTSYIFWTYHPIWAYRGMYIPNPKGTPYPVNGRPVWVEIKEYKPFLGSDFSDNGPWLPALPYDYASLIGPDNNNWKHSGGGGAPTIGNYSKTDVRGYSSKGEISISIDDQPKLISKNIPSARYYQQSPSQNGDVFYRDACRIHFGESEYSNVSELSTSSPRAKWGYTRLVDHKSAHHFIGVINE